MKTSALFMLVVSLVIAHMAGFSLFSSNEDVVDKPIDEDAYYVFTIARNIANGDGVTYNFNIKTNGFQPLVALPYTLIYFVTEHLNLGSYVPIRLILLLNIFFWMLSGLITRQIAYKIAMQSGMSPETRELSANLAFLLLLVNINLLRIYLYGLETGLYLLLILQIISVLLNYPHLRDLPFRDAIYIGILLGLTVLARIDFGIILLGMFSSHLLFRKISIRAFLVISIIVLVIALPWFAYNYLVFGNVMPSSGRAQAASEITLRSIVHQGSVAFYSINNFILTIFWLPIGFLGRFEQLLRIAQVISISLLLGLLRKEIARVLHWHIASMLAGCILLIGLYVIFIGATHFYSRYFSPFSVIWIVILSVSLAGWLERNKQFQKLLPYLVMSVFIVYLASAAYTLHRGTNSNTHTYTVSWLDENISPSIPVGAFQSGIVGYFHPNVYNLDGKVNGDALESWRHGDLECYILKNRMKYLIDWADFLSRLNPDFLKQNTEYIATIPGGAAMVLRIKEDIPYTECNRAD